ncbi:MAG TPA: hypothetical protein DDX92_06465 [Flavobacteriales bacterium]|nr:hypothetical protein [Flavobacteriales bacterium]
MTKLKVYRIYTDIETLRALPRGQQSDLVKQYTGTSDINKRLVLELSDSIKLEKSISDAEVAVLPAILNYYVEKNKLIELEFFLDKAASKGIKVVALNKGDDNVRVPFYDDLIIYKSGGLRSKMRSNEYGLPVMISDKWNDYYSWGFTFPHSDHPTIGFCGQGSATAGKVLAEYKRTFVAKFNKSKDYEGVFSQSRLRANALSELEGDKTINSQFIIRDRYSFHKENGKLNYQSQNEFYENIRDNQYTLAIRGGGNFSVRFYETMMMGRIPLFVDADSPLPFEGSQIADQLFPVHDLKKSGKTSVSETLLNYHQGRSPKELEEVALQMRRTWESNYSRKGFIKTAIRLAVEQ